MTIWRPWWPPERGIPAHCANAWVWLGAAGHATRSVAIGSAVTTLVHRHNPVLVAQQIAMLEALFPGPAFLGVGSGEAMNEVPAGMHRPPVRAAGADRGGTHDHQALA